jgi:selenocysteine-specific elongation factor
VSEPQHAPAAVTRTLILGTAGHVDHGKTALVKALTGIDTDRLPEEKARGISIELGFAHLDLPGGIRLGIVDVPGHERFVRQMVAGAGGMDLAMLLIAADEGVMPQTREHLDVLHMLGVGAGLVVITKRDLVEPALLALVADEAHQLVAETFLAAAPIVTVSALTGEGLPHLRDELLRLAARVAPRARVGDFRLPVDRVFVLQGSGVVVTGTAFGGSVRAGDKLRLLPAGAGIRVREVQSHGDPVAEAGAGERVALSLHGVKKEEIERGDQLVSGDGWQPARVLGVRLEAVVGLDEALRTRARFHVHHAAREVLGRLDLLEGGTLAAGQSGLARLHLEVPLVAAPGDRLVLRSYSPMVTVAGGVVLDPQLPLRQRRGDALLWLLRIAQRGPRAWPLLRIARAELVGCARADLRPWYSMLGLGQPDADRAVDEAVRAGSLLEVGDRVLDAACAQQAAQRALELLREHQQVAPMSPGLPREELRQALGFRGTPQHFAQLLSAWTAQLPLFSTGDRVRADSAAPQLTGAQQAGLGALERRIAQAGAAYEASEAELRSPELPLLVGSGRVVRLGGRLLAHRDALDDLVRRVAGHFARTDRLEIAHVKEWTQASRKFVVPLMEWLDAADITRFADGARRRGPKCPTP